MESNRDIFIKKLDNFIQKYYLFQILRGVLLTVIFLIAFYLCLSIFEYHLYLSAKVKTILMFVGLSLQLVVLILFIVLPCIGLLSQRFRISYRKAISIISRHYPEMEDKLLNTYELNEKVLQNSEEGSLLIASINKRIASFSFLSFRESISFKSAYIYLKYLALILFFATVLYYVFPDFYSTTGVRLMHFQEDFKAPADFEFILESDLWVEKGEDYLLKVRTEGKYMPQSVDLVYGGQKYLMISNDSGLFTYKFRRLNSDIQFEFQSGKIKSNTYSLHLKSKPILDKLEIKINPPKYTGLSSRLESQIGDLTVPVGSNLEWLIEAYDADTLSLSFIKKGQTIFKAGAKLKFADVILEPDTYEISLANKTYVNTVYAKYQLEVLPDLFPSIAITSQSDSLNFSVYYFKGIIKDDYGFTKLNFVYQSEDGVSEVIKVPIHKKLNHQEFYFVFDFSSIKVPVGTRLQYYFEVFDNDEVNKPKSSKSDYLNYFIPNAEQVFELNSSIQDSLRYKIDQSREISRSIQQEVQKLQKSFFDNSNTQWQQNQMFSEIKSKKNRLENLLKEIKKDNARKNQLMKAVGLQDSLLLDKQKKIEELMDKIMDDELEKIFDKFNKLASKLDRDKINKTGNQLKMSMDDFQKQLDLNLQLLERYEVELGVNQISSRIEQLAKDQEELSQLGKKDKESIIGKQVALEMQWERIEKDLGDLLKKNSKIQKPFDLNEFSIEREGVKKEMQESLDLLRDNKMNKAEKSMQRASQQQYEISQKLANSMAEGLSMQMETDTDLLKQLLIDFIDFSFQQEDLFMNLKKISKENPLYVNIIDKQGALKEMFYLQQDSLLSLSARMPQLAVLIGDRIFNLKDLLNQSLDDLNSREVSRAERTQQKVMTEINELAVLLSEVLEQIEAQMSHSASGGQSGNKKGKKPSFSGMKSQMESLKKMLEDMIQSMESGEGESGKQGEKLGKYLKEQEMFRQKMKEMIQNGGHGEQTDKILREALSMMEEAERETSNFSVNEQSLVRQKQIMTRLLEAENASRENEFDEKRESQSSSNYKLRDPKEIFKSKKMDGKFDDLLNDSNVKLMEYYNKIYLDYLIRLNNED